MSKLRLYKSCDVIKPFHGEAALKLQCRNTDSSIITLCLKCDQNRYFDNMEENCLFFVFAEVQNCPVLFSEDNENALGNIKNETSKTSTEDEF